MNEKRRLPRLNHVAMSMAADLLAEDERKQIVAPHQIQRGTSLDLGIGGDQREGRRHAITRALRFGSKTLIRARERSGLGEVRQS